MSWSAGVLSYKVGANKKPNPKTKSAKQNISKLKIHLVFFSSFFQVVKELLGIFELERSRPYAARMSLKAFFPPSNAIQCSSCLD
jgi:hypothetical protein